MHCLVTGGGGFLGLYIVEQLVARGDRVRVLCRGNYPRLAELGVEQITGDIRQLAQVEAACAGVDTVFHTAAISGIWGSWPTYHETNTVGTQNVISGCQRHGVSRLVHTSSPSVIYDGTDHLRVDETHPYPETYLCNYPRSKRLAEEAVLAANGTNGLATVALRPHLLWGPRDNHLIPRLIARARAGRLWRIGDGRNVISMSYVENAAAAHLQAAELKPTSRHAGRAYFINEREPVTLWEWVDKLLRRAGLPPVARSMGRTPALVLGGLLEAVWFVARLRGEPPMTRFLAQQLSGSHTYSTEAAERDFGYHPRISVDEGLRRLDPDLQRLANSS